MSSADGGMNGAMRAARTPVGVGSAPLVALVVALLLIALGVVAVRDALVEAGALGGTSWTQGAIDWVDGTEPTAGVVAASLAVIVLGLLLLVPVFWRRPRKAVALDSRTGVFLRTPDLAKIARATTRDIDGVTDVRARASRRKIVVTAHTIIAKDEAREVRNTVSDQLVQMQTALAKPLRAKVRIKSEAHAP